MLSHLDKVWHMHFHDWDGKSDHQIPFTGQLPCDRYLRLAKDNEMSVLVEVKTEEAVRSAINIMRDRGCIPALRSF
jgi:sugar phosphate isomerase/epimerase